MMAPKPGHTLCSGNSLEGTYLLARRCPVQSRRESVRSFVRNLRAWLALLREKAQAAEPRGRKYRWAKQGRTAP